MVVEEMGSVGRARRPAPTGMMRDGQHRKKEREYGCRADTELLQDAETSSAGENKQGNKSQVDNLSANERSFYLQLEYRKGERIMDEMTQPQVVQTANQPDNVAVSAQTQSGTPPTSEQARSEAADKPFLTVRYNKQDKPLSREEAAVYAQKGMNYDKLSEKLKVADEQLKSLSGTKALAAENTARSGMVETEALSAMQSKLNGQDMQAAVRAQLDVFVAANPDIDPRKLPESVLTEWKRGVPLNEGL